MQAFEEIGGCFYHDWDHSDIVRGSKSAILDFIWCIILFLFNDDPQISQNEKKVKLLKWVNSMVKEYKHPVQVNPFSLLSLKLTLWRPFQVFRAARLFSLLLQNS